jgi:hypothetical protein
MIHNASAPKSKHTKTIASLQPDGRKSDNNGLEVFSLQRCPTKCCPHFCGITRLHDSDPMPVIGLGQQFLVSGGQSPARRRLPTSAFWFTPTARTE